MSSVAVVGAGITGLTASYLLQDTFDVHLFEAEERAGGVIHSERRDGYLVEHGPNTVRGGSEPLEEILGRLDLSSRRIYPGDTAAKRFIARDGAPVAVPLNVLSFLTSNLLSISGKLRLLGEPFRSAADYDPEETVETFLSRRLGREVVDYGVDPFLAGVYAGAPDRLSAAHVVPTLHGWERDHGSLLLGAIFGRSSKSDSTSSGGDRRIFTFPDGLRELPEALARRLEPNLNTHKRVTGVRPVDNRWQLTIEHQDGRETAVFDAVLLTVPLHQFDDMQLDVDVDLGPLQEVPYPPLSVLALGFHRDQVRHALDGFGVLIPRKEPFQILGALFSSSLAPGRAPDDHVLLTAFIGGMRTPQRARLSTADLLELARHDLANLLGITGSPSFYHRVRYPHAIPQYIPGYQRALDTLDVLEARYPGIYMAGNFRDGISVGDAMGSAAGAVARIERFA